MFTGQYADVWYKVCWISCLHNISLLHIFDSNVQNISHRILADISDIGIFLLLSASAPKIPYQSGPVKKKFFKTKVETPLSFLTAAGKAKRVSQ